MTTRDNKWTRRAVLSGLAAGAVLSPFVPLLAGDAEAQTPGLPKRLIIFFHPNGYGLAAKYFPTGTETSFTLSEILAPLEPHKGNLVIFKGINNPAGPDSGNNVHIPHMGSILTGIPIQRGTSTPFFEGDYQYGWANGISVDQFLAQKIAAMAGAPPFPSLDYHCIGNSDVVKTQTRMSYTGPGTPVVPEIDPHAALKRILTSGGGTGGTGGTGGAGGAGGAAGTGGAGGSGGVVDAVARAQSERRSALDYLKGDLARVSQRVGTVDRARLDGHLTSLRELEGRIPPPPGVVDAGTGGTGGAGGAGGAKDGGTVGPAVCKSVPIPAFASLKGPATYRDRGKAFIDVIVQALACDATRVVGLQWANTGGAGGVTFSWLGHTEDEHLASHTPDQKVVDTKIYYMQQLAYLIAALKNVPEGGGTLFDSTMILVLSEHGLGATHDNVSIPFIFAGNAGGAFKTGRYLQYQSVPQNQLLVSVCRAMGVTVDTFGSTKYAAGPLAGLA